MTFELKRLLMPAPSWDVQNELLMNTNFYSMKQVTETTHNFQARRVDKLENCAVKEMCYLLHLASVHFCFVHVFACFVQGLSKTISFFKTSRKQRIVPLTRFRTLFSKFANKNYIKRLLLVSKFAHKNNKKHLLTPSSVACG